MASTDITVYHGFYRYHCLPWLLQTSPCTTASTDITVYHGFYRHHCVPWLLQISLCTMASTDITVYHGFYRYHCVPQLLQTSLCSTASTDITVYHGFYRHHCVPRLLQISLFTMASTDITVYHGFYRHHCVPRLLQISLFTMACRHWKHSVYYRRIVGLFLRCFESVPEWPRTQYTCCRSELHTSAVLLHYGKATIASTDIWTSISFRIHWIVYEFICPYICSYSNRGMLLHSGIRTLHYCLSTWFRLQSIRFVNCSVEEIVTFTPGIFILQEHWWCAKNDPI